MSTRRSKEISKRKETRTSPPSQVFEFINLNNNTLHLKDDDRSIIREVVMNNFHQKKRQKTSSTQDSVPSKGSVIYNIPPPQLIRVFELESPGKELNGDPWQEDWLPASAETEDVIEVPHLQSHTYEACSENEQMGWAKANSQPASSEPILHTNYHAGISRRNTIEVQRLIPSLDLIPRTLGQLFNLPIDSNPRTKFLIAYFCKWSKTSNSREATKLT